MPIYEYICKGCGEATAIQRKIEERDEPVLCNTCNSTMFRSLNSVPVHFNAAGFYRTGG